jgi:hypothetical protein
VGDESGNEGGTPESDDGQASSVLPRGLGTLPEEIVDNSGAFAVGLDWPWYGEMSKTDITIDGESDVGWSIQANQQTASNPPANPILRTPVYGVFFGAVATSQAVVQYSSLADPIFEQMGYPSGADTFDPSTNRVEEVLVFGRPGIVVASGDIEPSRLVEGTDDFAAEGAEYGYDVYEGVPGEPTNTGGLGIGFNADSIVLSTGQGENAINEAAFSSVLEVQSNGEVGIGGTQPMIELGGEIESAPVVVGEFGGRSFPVNESTGYSERGIERLPEVANIVHGFDTDGEAARAQTAFYDGGELDEGELAEAFDAVSGDYSYDVEADVATVEATWGESGSEF